MKVKPKKALGQHFLTNREAAMRIAKAMSFHKGYEPLLEIGPGTGALTTCLLEAHPDHDLKVMEIDAESIIYLVSEGILEKKQVIPEDFLRADLVKHMGESFGVVGNFPYNISTQILFRVFDYRENVPEVVGMFQKEVAERVASPHGSKVYGILSVLLQLFYEIEYLFTVEPEDFDPPPKVRSGVIRMQRNDVVDLGCPTDLLVKVVKTGFNQRRKMLRKSLKGILNGGELSEAFATMRPEQLSPQQFVELTKEVEKLNA